MVWPDWLRGGPSPVWFMGGTWEKEVKWWQSYRGGIRDRDWRYGVFKVGLLCCSMCEVFFFFFQNKMGGISGNALCSANWRGKTSEDSLSCCLLAKRNSVFIFIWWWVFISTVLIDIGDKQEVQWHKTLHSSFQIFTHAAWNSTSNLQRFLSCVLGKKIPKIIIIIILNNVNNIHDKHDLILIYYRTRVPYLPNPFNLVVTSSKCVIFWVPKCLKCIHTAHSKHFRTLSDGQ